MGEQVDTDLHKDELPRHVLGNLLEGCQVIGPDFRYLYVNDAAAQHGNASVDELLGRTMMEAYPGIEETEMFALLRECMEEREVGVMENEFTYPDGRTGWFELRMQPVPEGLTILSVDITERKRAEHSLERTISALNTLSRCNQTLVRARDEARFVEDVCHIMNEEGKYPLVWVQVRGEGGASSVTSSGAMDAAKRESLVNADWARRLVDEVAEADEPIRLSIDQEEADVPGWFDAVEKYGLETCLALPIRSENATLGTLVVCDHTPFSRRHRGLLVEIAMDLGHGIETIRARAEQAATAKKLSEAKERTRAIYDHLPDATFVWQQREEGFELVDCNAVARSVTAATGTNLPGTSIEIFEDGIPNIGDYVRRCFEDRTVIRRETECTLPGAEQSRQMELTYGFIPPDMVLLHARDVTEQRRTEKQLIASQRLEAVGRLAGGVAHDFNNLLSVILTFSRLSIDELPESNPVRADLEEIHEAGERAAELTDQLLAFSRAKIMEPRVVNIDDAVEGIEGMLRRLIGEDIDIRVHTGDAGNVLADPGQLEQVLMNLAVNARDAMPKGGKLTIETSNVELDAAYAREHVDVRPGEHVQLTVTDTGEGMEKETLDRIFEPFFTTKETGKGTGLGLATVYGIVKQSGGHIWVYSEPGCGTTFKVHFPRVDAPVVEERQNQPAVRASGGETIMVVEDEAAVREAAARILRSVGYTVLTVSGGPEAIETVQRHAATIDLVLTDVVMPEMNGKELADRLKEIRPHLRVLFTSGYTGNAIAHHGVLDSGIEFIGKPFSVSELTRRVRQVLDGG